MGHVSMCFVSLSIFTHDICAVMLQQQQILKDLLWTSQRGRAGRAWKGHSPAALSAGCLLRMLQRTTYWAFIWSHNTTRASASISHTHLTGSIAACCTVITCMKVTRRGGSQPAFDLLLIHEMSNGRRVWAPKSTHHFVCRSLVLESSGLLL